MPSLPILSDSTRRALALARSAAARAERRTIDTEHLLIGLLEEPSRDALSLLAEVGVDTQRLRVGWPKMSPPVGHPAPIADPALPYAEDAKHAILATATEARLDGHDVAQPRHLLRALTVASQCTAARVLADVGASLQVLRREDTRP